LSDPALAKIDRFAALKAKMPQSELPRWSLAQAYEEAGRTLDAFREYGELVTLKPDYCLAWLRLGAIAMHELADLAVAREALTEARRLAVAQGHNAPRLEVDALLEELEELSDEA
jgi:hypothetical protein